ncbi:MAG: LLM class F420-dependent oxidoreductase [Betaproteobacteria bacterium]|nr:LLM class F420-dependent oxidoreductase [Betaproteobacteria bacterium]
MKIGAIFPHNEITDDPTAVRDYAQAAEDLGFNHLLAYDHVLGASGAAYDQQRLLGPYREGHLFHEPFVLFGFIAGLTSRIELATGVIILPQRQTALVAKQAAEVDLLSRGRLRLGVGTGWNWVEYEALGMNFKDRGARQAEQIRLLRELWTKPLVNFQGRYHKVTDAGLNPLPVQRPIPIWLGGMADAVLKRVGEMADGWYPRFHQLDPLMVSHRQKRPEAPAELVARVHQYARDAGRDPAKIGIEGFVAHAGRSPDAWMRDAEGYRAAGATHVSFNTMYSGLKTPAEHIEAIRKFRALF